MKTVTITRHELYERVWQESMRRLARSFGLSDVGLAKVCRKQDIPRPPRGYWAKQQAGQPVHRDPLPDPGKNPTITLSESDLSASHQFPDDIRHEIELAQKGVVEFEIRETLRGAHALVSQANEVLSGARSDENGLLIRPEGAPLALRVQGFITASVVDHGRIVARP